jgi:hypothetical protein
VRFHLPQAAQPQGQWVEIVEIEEICLLGPQSTNKWLRTPCKKFLTACQDLFKNFDGAGKHKDLPAEINLIKQQLSVE